MGVKCDAVVI